MYEIPREQQELWFMLKGDSEKNRQKWNVKRNRLGNECLPWTSPKQIDYHLFKILLVVSFSPTHLKNMRQSKWILFSKFRGSESFNNKYCKNHQPVREFQAKFRKTFIPKFGGRVARFSWGEKYRDFFWPCHARPSFFWSILVTSLEIQFVTQKHKVAG